ncbi:MAG: YcbK family protein [Deltaproteobacteria bacterium]|nr:YcbK family protein [Deltaproteobacteria bacterium]
MRASAGAAVVALAVTSFAAAQSDAGRASAPASSYPDLPPLQWIVHNTGERAEIRLYRGDGSVDPSAHRELSHLLRDARRNREIEIDVRLLRLTYRIAYHFRARSIRVISGYRSRTSRSHSHHKNGTALDFRLEGIATADVARYARYLGRVGVGHYTTSDFVHLDVRDVSYYWRSGAGPRRRGGWNRPLARVGARERDTSWTDEMDAPWDPPGFSIPTPDPTDEPIRGVRRPRRHRQHHAPHIRRRHSPGSGRRPGRR